MKKIGTLILIGAVALLVSTAVWAAHSDHGLAACHTPHHSSSGEVPLWNGNATTATDFVYYTSSSLDAAPGQPDGSSKLCLACHDGSNPAYSWSTMGTEFVLGTDLSTTHPISFIYDADLANKDQHLKLPSDQSTIGGTIEHDLLENGRMQCSSCHDIHSSGIGTTMLRGYDAANVSSLCRMCHVR